jgi:hypothetical protein
MTSSSRGGKREGAGNRHGNPRHITLDKTTQQQLADLLAWHNEEMGGNISGRELVAEMVNGSWQVQARMRGVVKNTSSLEAVEEG